MSDNVLQKIMTSNLSSGGLLNAEQFRKFFTSTMNNSVLLSAIRTIAMSAPTMEIDKINANGRVAQARVEGSTPNTEAGITSGLVELASKSIIVPWSITDELRDENIEGNELENTLITIMSNALSNDLEDLAINGNTVSGADAFLKLMNGFMKKITASSGTHVVEYTSNKPKLTIDVFNALLKKLPSKYRRNKSQLVFFVGSDAEQDFKNAVAARLTALGDKVMVTNDVLTVFGIEVIGVPFMKNMDAILTLRSNLIFGVFRQVKLEKDRDIYAGKDKYVLSTRVANAIENDDAIAYTHTMDYTA